MWENVYMNDELDNQLFEELLNLKFEVASDTDDADPRRWHAWRAWPHRPS